MVLRFCPQCENLLSPKKINNEFFLSCPNCDFCLNPDQGILKINEKIKSKKERGKGAIKDENTFARYEHTCKKCGYNQSQVLDLGIFYSDEDNLILLKCGKCGFSERIGRKTS